MTRFSCGVASGLAAFGHWVPFSVPLKVPCLGPCRRQLLGWSQEEGGRAVLLYSDGAKTKTSQELGRYFSGRRDGTDFVSVLGQTSLAKTHPTTTNSRCQRSQLPWSLPILIYSDFTSPTWCMDEAQHNAIHTAVFSICHLLSPVCHPQPCLPLRPSVMNYLAVPCPSSASPALVITTTVHWPSKEMYFSVKELPSKVAFLFSF